MADPKYAGLPGIATDQPDMYETFSDRDTDPEDESESEPSEALHMSSLSCVGPDLEIVEAGATETLMQKFTRLHCEVNEFCEDLNSMTESVREGSLAGLHIQVDKLRENLENISRTDDGKTGGEMADTEALNCDISSQAKHLQAIQQRITNLEIGDSDPSPLQYDLYVRKSEPPAADLITRLDQRLARLEKIVHAQEQQSPKVLSVKTDNLPLLEALHVLQSKKHNLHTDHLTHVEGRLSALTTKLNSLKEHKDRLNAAKSASQVAKIFHSLEANVGMTTVIPEVEKRLEDVTSLNREAVQWNSRLTEVSSDQEKTEALITQNSEKLESTKKNLGDGLLEITKSLEDLQTDLAAMKA